MPAAKKARIESYADHKGLAGQEMQKCLGLHNNELYKMNMITYVYLSIYII